MNKAVKLESGLVYGVGRDSDDKPTYSVMDKISPFREQIAKAIHDQEWYGQTGYYLVRMGEDRWYPLPLLFATPAVQESNARHNGVTPPTASWTKRKVNALKREFADVDFSSVIVA